jgi:ubiquinone/menaquinone biosynthesis C-methylase UbiE
MTLSRKEFIDFQNMLAKKRPILGIYYGEDLAKKWDMRRSWCIVKNELQKIDLDGKNLLDTGCGMGFFEKNFSSILKNSYVSGIDISPINIKEARKFCKEKNITFKVANAERMPFIDETFDIILMSDVIEHVLNPTLCFKEMKRVLKKDGVIFLIVPVCPDLPFKKSLIFLYRKHYGWKHFSDKHIEEHLRTYTLQTLKYELSKYFEIEKIIKHHIFSIFITFILKHFRSSEQFFYTNANLFDSVDFLLSKLLYTKVFIKMKIKDGEIIRSDKK